MSSETKGAPRRFRISGRAVGTRVQRLARLALFSMLTLGLAGGVAAVGVYSYYAPTVPEFRSIEDYQPKLGSRIYSADNQLIGEFAAERRVWVPAEKIPKLLLAAFTSAEDKRFYSHIGIDFLGVAQALADKLKNPGAKLRGASTITQQVAKSLLATTESYEKATERSLSRKIREAILAWRLERSLTKDEILFMYVTQIFLGHKAYGVQAAAEHYFQKNVWELSLAEMATLAGLPQRPSDYSPVSRPEAAYKRREYVLRRMLDDGHITEEQHDQAVKEQIVVYPRYELYLKIAPYYTEQVRREIVDRYGERALLEDGLEVFTAVDLGYQNFAQRAVAHGLKDLDKRQGFRGPLAHLTKKQWPLFRARYREQLGLADGQEIVLAENTHYLALVESIAPKGKTVDIDLAGEKGLLPLAGMRWARKPNPNERVDLHYLEDASRVLKVGDVITVLYTTRERLARDEHGWDVLDTIPKDNELPLFALDQEPIANGSLMTVDPRTGYVVAQEGGYSFEESNFNRAVQACREPGSAFKPIVYSAAIDKLDYTASTLVDDKPMLYDDPENEVRWKPNNAGMEFRGLLPLRTCLMDSVNTPAIRIAEAVGIDDIMKNARNLGISSAMKRELGTALGSSCTTLYDLMEVYTAINQYGLRRDLHFVRRVVDRYGNVLEDHTDPGDPLNDLATRLDRAYLKLLTPRKRALDAQTAFITLSLMKNVVKYGTGIGASKVNEHIAGKTGTTDDSYDAWFMAFTRNLVTGVWVGHDQKERPLGVSEQGGRTALPIWVEYMNKVLLDYTAKPMRKIEHPDFPPPVGVVKVSIDPDTGLLARPESARAVEEWYRAGSEPTEVTPDKGVLNPEQGNIWQDDTPL